MKKIEIISADLIDHYCFMCGTKNLGKEGIEKVCDHLVYVGTSDTEPMYDKLKLHKESNEDKSSHEIIEELDHELVRIRQFHSGMIKKKMRIGSMREYVWSEGGLDILIEDYMLYVNYLQNTELKNIWEDEYSDSLKFKIFNPIDYKKGVDEAINDLLDNIQKFKDYEKTGYYENTQGMNTGDHAYYMEVTAVEDSIVIAKIIGSKNAVYRVRKGDWIYITK